MKASCPGAAKTAADALRSLMPASASAYSTFTPGSSSWSMSGCGEAPATQTAAFSSQHALSQFPKFFLSRTGICTNRHDDACGMSILR